MFTAPFEVLRDPDGDKARLAEALDGVGHVLLHGSVHKGIARRDSDIDIVIILDDLDYSQRRKKLGELLVTAEAVTSRRPDIWLTDWPEWTGHQSQEWQTLAKVVESDHEVICENPPGPSVNWSKEIPNVTNWDNAIAHLEGMARAITQATDQLPLSPSERHHLSIGNRERANIRIQRRRTNLCSAADMVMEQAEKAMMYMSSDVDVSPVRTHKHNNIKDRLDPELRAEVLRILEPLRRENFSLINWRVQGTYADPAEVSEHVRSHEFDEYNPAPADITEAYVQASIQMAELAMRRLEENPHGWKPGLLAAADLQLIPAVEESLDMFKYAYDRLDTENKFVLPPDRP